MCGICGIYNYADSKKNVDIDLVERMCNRIIHRGPDDGGVFVKGPVGIGNRRLSIIDLSGGNQPIFNEDRSITIVYNGEIYNYRELREDLIKNGHVFSTNSDTEMILHSYEQYGLECLHKFNGMFAIAIWDDNLKRLFIARDRLGIKPLFYSVAKGCLTFGSEIKCILEGNNIERRVNLIAMDQYFALGYVPAPNTMFDGIKKLRPGHLIICDKDGVSIKRYWDVSFQPKINRPIESLIEEFIELLKSAVKMRLIADVPVGAFLSGGIDSSLIVKIMSKVSNISPRTFSIGFEDSIYDESPYAEIAAKNANAVHHNYPVKADIGDIFDKIIEAFDEPFADDGAIPCYHVCRETRNEVKVALSGLGGDELFGGYHRYLGFKLSKITNRIPFASHDIWKRIIKKIPESKKGGYTIDRMKRFIDSINLTEERRYISYLCNIDKNRRELLYNREIAQKINCDRFEENLIELYRHDKETIDDIDRAYYLDFMTYLPDDVLALTDRMSMWHSLEVRVPFLDHRLVEFSAKIEPNIKIKGRSLKYFLKKAAANFLPPVILNKRKQGFVGPMPLWLMKDLKDLTYQTFSPENLDRHGFFNTQLTSQILEEHMNRKRKHETFIWSLLVFDKWHRKYME